MEIKKIPIQTEYITLTQLLKLTDYISTGGHAKYFLFENSVYVNGKLEERRGRKLYPEDKVKIDEVEFLIVND